ncbi:TPA: alpha/beta fold hydrolase [Candidatus Gracilibacteria bacterium]|nr:alpha/beta fold hydrolase [Candidatus Gracilibacteria bacterium]HIQ57361.1 alpha/beta fold hydrolase [Candidatus Gracilibacteria bacterium]
MKIIKEKQVMIDGLRISYCENIEEKPEKITLFLHGWGSNKESFTLLFPLRKNIIALDFPAFGKSVGLTKAFNLNNYAVFLEKFIEKIVRDNSQNSKKINIEFIVHSFGGRVLLKYLENKNMKNNNSENINITNIICMGVPFYRNLTKIQKIQINFSKFLHKNKYTNSIKNIITPVFNFLFQNKNSDYNTLDGEVMKKTFQNIVNEDISVYIKNLNKYTNNSANLKLIWGENDEAAPLYYAKNVHKKYSASELCIVVNAGHFPWVDNFEEVKKVF